MTCPLLVGVDHCHLNVANLAESLIWYESVLGFTVIPELAFWNEGTGPLTLEDRGATVRLALFEGEGTSKGIAFGATGEQFLAWLKHLKDLNIKTVLADHKVTFSVYFKDNSGNSHEITSHDYQYIAGHLNN
ncbi:VOC family protein [Pseudoalteromonas sp. NEC-BIFX-2020_002]|uniref:VOC family protein n=1 Tax=Pseudoalteromonas neustonica TaxID=1840331 RepID=A0ABU9U706_9GAMM|nr:VOC family protein [Pseudoalteromonas sp. NEC-BIFX-2020_002]NNG42383.1 VOC family protein [Pseudoalteromonas sp. NEC-BIFX-2020_002]